MNPSDGDPITPIGARHHPAPGELAAEHVRTLAPYVPGKPIEELERELGIRDIIKLASNENPFGPSPLAVEAMQRALADTWLYPDGSGHLLKQKLAKQLGVTVEQITLGNGSNDVLVLLAGAFLAPGLEAVYSQYGFAVYPIAIHATGARGVCVPALPRGSPMELGHDLPAMARAINERTRIVFIANPNNPTGTWVEARELESFVAAAPRHVLVALDEAYFEYTAGMPLQNGIEWLERYPNLVVFRTFSKAYGLAGVRVGYAVSHPSVADMLNRVRQAFNVSTVGLAGAAAALDDPTHMAAAVNVAIAERARVTARLRELGTTVVPSAGNFLLLHAGPNARGRFDELLRRGIIVRPVGNYQLPEHLRVTLGTAEQNDRFLRAWEA
ncbi:MAG TPA: histidinol-phosphate transaminase [Steroidobacteraceae bacterium]|nr:histidinol-phosphate transaminase [Steroidobacteraceae bacterium]